MFRHPLRKEDLAKYLHFCPHTGENLASILASLAGLGLVGTSEGFYFLAGQESFVPVRKERTALAQRWSPRIATAARRLAHIPFVQGVALTGSLSKGAQDADGDIDLLVLSRPGRLWTSLFFISVFRRLLPRSATKEYCTNFLLASNHLSVQIRNLFTATEIVFLRPLVNGRLCEAFFRENAWVLHFYPRWTPTSHDVPHAPRRGLKGILEWTFSGKWGDSFESAFSKWYSERIRRNSKFLGPLPKEEWAQVDHIVLHSRARQRELQQAWKAALDDFQSRNRVQLVQWPWSWDHDRV
jgi:predicted nucleotidyltransferase